MTMLRAAIAALLIGCGPAPQGAGPAIPANLMEPTWGAEAPDAGVPDPGVPAPAPKKGAAPIDCDAMYDKDEAQCKAGPPEKYVACHTAARGRQGDCQQVK